MVSKVSKAGGYCQVSSDDNGSGVLKILTVMAMSYQILKVRCPQDNNVYGHVS